MNFVSIKGIFSIILQNPLRNLFMDKSCLKRLRSKEENLNFCLEYHSWIDQCPEVCSYYQFFQDGVIEEAVAGNYNIECLYFYRDHLKNSFNPVYFCKLMALESPYCDLCQFSCYSDLSKLQKVKITKAGIKK